jgi:dephospho-CoA kinase
VFRRRVKEDSCPIAVLDIPLLYETGRESEVDAVVVVSAPADRQRERALQRPGMSEAKLDWILARQWRDERKRAVADFVIDNTGDLEHLENQVLKLLRRLERLER